MSWAEQMRRFFDEKNDKERLKRNDALVVLPKIPQYLEGIVEERPFAISSKIIHKAQSQKDISHTVKEDDIRRLKEGMEKPVAVVFDQSRNSLFFLTDVLDEETGKPMVASFNLNEYFDQDYIHRGTSIHYRQDIFKYLDSLEKTQIFVMKKDELANLSGKVNILDRLQKKNKLIFITLPQTGGNVNTESGKNSLRMAEAPSVASGDSSPRRGAMETAEEAAQMEQLQHSLGIETQNSRLAQKVEGYEQLTRQQDVKIRQLQRMLSQAGVRVYADGNKVRTFASGLLRDYGAQRMQGLDRRKISDAMEALYNSMANDGASRDAAQIQAGEIAERILAQSKYLNPEISEYSRTILDDVKSIGVRLSDAQKQEMAYRYGSYGAFYRQTFGKLKIRNDGVSLDSRWQELAAAEIRREIGKVKSRSRIGTTPPSIPSPFRAHFRRAFTKL